MDFIIRKILTEMSEEKALTEKEIILFKYLNTKFQQDKRKDKFFDDVKRGLKMFSLNPKDVQYYFDLFINNYREDGKYNEITKKQFKGPKDFKAKKTTNVDSKNFSRNKLPFKGSNLEGYWDTDINMVQFYVIKSYNWYPIYLYKKGVWYRTINTYSNSTAKQIRYSNPIEYDNKINQLVVLVTRDEMEKLMRNAELDDIIKYKKERLLKDKSLYTNKEKTIKNYEWEDNTTPIKIKFKIKDIKEKNGEALVEVEVLDVFKRENNKAIKTPENYLKGEIPNITKEKVENRIKREITSNFQEYIGSSDIESPIKFKFIHSKR